MPSTLKNVVERKIDAVQNLLKNTDDGSPLITLSVGVAFSDSKLGNIRLFDAADQALYSAKKQGENTYCIYENKAEAF